MPRLCIFCGSDASVDPSVEHVNPLWLLEHLGTTAQDQMFQGVVNAATNELTSSRVHATRRFVEGRVCAACNGGWMSSLESAAQPILVPLIENRRAVWQLTPDEAFTISKWAAKTSYVLSYVTPGNGPVEPEHLAMLRRDEGHIPAGVGVFAWQFGFDRPSSYFQSSRWPQIIRRGGSPSALETPPLAYKIALQYRNLMLLVTFWPHEPFQYALAAGLHVPVWPREPFVRPAYVADVGAPNGTIELMRAFTESLGVLTT
jgi:hypothetical protein